MRLVVAPRAEREAADAARHYEAARPGLGLAFKNQLDATLRRIARYPGMAQAIVDGVRRALLHQFPYCVVYRVLDAEIQVLGIFPTNADPHRTFSRMASTAASQ